MKKNTKSVLLLLALGWTIPACVSSSEYDRVQRRLQETEARLQQTQALLEEKNEVQKKLRNHLNQKSDEMGQLNTQMTSLKSRYDSREEELAQANRENQKLAATLEEKELALASASRSKEDQERVLEAYNKDLKSLIDSGDLSVSLVNGKLVVAMPSDVLYPTGSAQISERGQNTIRELGLVFTKLREKRLQVEGHTDDVPVRTGRFQSNWHLGYSRAMAVIDLLTRAGVRPSQLSAASYGEHQPKVPNVDAESRQKNRRIEIIVVPDLTPLAAH